MRKNVLKYDDVMNRHRGRIYEQRRQVLDGEDMSEQVTLWIDELVEDTVLSFTQEEYSEEWDLEALTNAMAQLYGTEITAQELREDLGELTREALIEEFQADARDEYAAKEEEFGAPTRRSDARARALRDPPGRRCPLARAPREHGLPARGRAPALDGAEGSARRVHGRGRAHVHRARRARSASEVVLHLFHAELAPEEAQQLDADADDERQPPVRARDPRGRRGDRGRGRRGAAARRRRATGVLQQTVQASPHEKLGRNDPCWCGSGKKFKNCHGA